MAVSGLLVELLAGLAMGAGRKVEETVLGPDEERELEKAFDAALRIAVGAALGTDTPPKTSEPPGLREHAVAALKDVLNHREFGVAWLVWPDSEAFVTGAIEEVWREQLARRLSVLDQTDVTGTGVSYAEQIHLDLPALVDAFVFSLRGQIRSRAALRQSPIANLASQMDHARLEHFIREIRLALALPLDQDSYSAKVVYETDDAVAEVGPWGAAARASKVRVSRLHEYGHAPSVGPDLRIARVEIDCDRCLWYRMAELNPRDGIHMSDDFRDPELEPLYQAAAHFFHQQTRTEGDQRTHDPILDVVLLNDSPQSTLVEGLFVRPLAVWPIPKAIYVPRVVPVHRTYSLRVDFASRYCGLEFANPWLLNSGGAWRFLLTLIDFLDIVSEWRANESLISLQIRTNAGPVESRPIYLGVL